MSIDLVQVLNIDLNSNNDILTNKIKLLRIQYLKKSNKLKVIVKCYKELNTFEEKYIKDTITKKLDFLGKLDLIVYKDISNVSIQEIAKKYWLDIVNNLASSVPVSKECLLTSVRKIESNTLNICSGNSFICNILKGKNIESMIKNTIFDMFGMNISIKLDFDSALIQKDYFEIKETENKDILKQINQEVSATKQTVTNKSYNQKQGFDYSTPKNENTIMGRNICEDIITINNIDETSGKVAICGDVFKVEIIETKTGRKIVTFNITDYTSSITVKCFPKPKDVENVIDQVKVGLYCKVKGEAINDPYAKEVVLMVRDIVKMTKIERMDMAEEKRVELHMHSQMSSMDGVTSVSRLVERAAKWGHKAVAITDHGVVQAYPEAMEAGKKNKIKIIYGIEAYLVDDGVPIATNADSKKLEDTFIVFDLETTGFSSTNDKIIEIGAVKIKDGLVIDEFSHFINPKISIPYKITELTGITDDMVKGAEDIEIVMNKFKDFAKDGILVAHNASFDVSFIKKNYKNMGYVLNNGILDTIPLAKFLFPELKRFKLDVVAKHLGISLENHHRAVDDAMATASILLHCFSLLKDRNILNIQTLNKEFLQKQDYKKMNTYHLIILVKNQIGLKNLYKLVSYSHLDYFYKKPRMLKSLIEEYREGLIIGSACEAGQIYREVLQGKTFEELKPFLEFYDYLEIQPTANNIFLIKKGNVKDELELEEINKKIYDLAVKSNKPVVATCDVHFLDAKDEVFRKILMVGQGFSDADKQPPLYFRTTNEMLKEFEYLGEKKAKEVVIYNPLKILDMINDVKPIPDETFTPKIDGAEEDVKNMTLDKAHSIYGELLPEIVQQRVDKELNSIISHGYAVLYLIAHKLVAKSLEDGYLVGSRGSVGSSFVATMTDITEVNGLPPHYVCPHCKKSEFILDGSVGSGADLPDKRCPSCGAVYVKDGDDIPFETFLGFNGDKEPDIDLNFSGDNQAAIHKYTEILFGKGYTYKAGTIGTIAEKTAYGFVKKYLDGKDTVVSKAEIDRLILGCSGVKRTTGQHPGGIMVVPRDNDIFNFTPIQHPANDNNTDIITTHFDYHSISGRLLKLDILGHDDPTMLRMLQDLTGIDPKTIPLDDKKVMSLFTSTEALGVTAEELNCELGTYGLPEFGTKFVRQMLLETTPKTFSDLVRISGLSHGTDVWINNAQYYIKEGMTTLSECISTRDDIMIYLMHQGLAPKTSFTIMEKVRKGKGLREEDIDVMKKNNVPSWYIESCQKIKYMFPKGHAVAYVMMAVRIAYFKVHYPSAYYATYFTVRADDFDADLIVKGEQAIMAKMSELSLLGNTMTQKDKGLLTTLEISYEMNKRGIKFLKVDLYKSESIKFKIEVAGIRPPLKALQGLSENAAKSIVEARVQGEFISKEDLRIRTKIGKSIIETMSNHGCLNQLPETNQLSLF